MLNCFTPAPNPVRVKVPGCNQVLFVVPTTRIKTLKNASKINATTVRLSNKPEMKFDISTEVGKFFGKIPELEAEA
jgi:hypothetical protein